MSNKKTDAQRVPAPQPTKASVVAGTHLPSADDKPTPIAKTHNPGATMSPLRPWRGTPRPGSWQPGSWDDPL